MTTKITLSSVLFLCAVATGIWLNKMGAPYKPLAFNLHKFIVLALVVLAVIIIKNVFKSYDLNSQLWITIIASAVFIVMLFVSGGILSIKQNAQFVLVAIHTISSVMLSISLGGFFYLILHKI